MATHNLTVMNHAAIHGKKGFKGKHGKHGYGIGSSYEPKGGSKKDKKNKAKGGHKVSDGASKETCDACTIF